MLGLIRAIAYLNISLAKPETCWVFVDIPCVVKYTRGTIVTRRAGKL